MSAFVVVGVFGWWESNHYTARVIAVRDTEEDAVTAMLADAAEWEIDVDPPEDWERDAVGVTVTSDGREAYRIEQPADKRVSR